MSIQFSNTGTTSINGILQYIEEELGFDAGNITGNAALLKTFTSAVNLALDRYISIAIQASGKWQFDDSNQTDYPIITTNIISGQRDYSFTTDGTGNIILDIYKVAILPSATATLYQGIDPSDEVSYDSDLVTNETATGTPWTYGKLANGIFLEPKPSYNATSGLKVFINREGSYFATTDTTKKPGVPMYHEYFYLRPARDYARRNSLASFDRLNNEVIKLEGDDNQGITGLIAKYFGKREKDDRPVMENEGIIYQ